MKRKIAIVFVIILLSAGTGIGIYNSIINPHPVQQSTVTEVKDENQSLKDFGLQVLDKNKFTLIALFGSLIALGIYKHKTNKAINKNEEEQ